MKKFYIIISFASLLHVAISVLRTLSLIPPVIKLIESIAYLILVIIFIIKFIKSKKNKTKNTEDDSM